jgi:hypothetical protein
MLNPTNHVCFINTYKIIFNFFKKHDIKTEFTKSIMEKKNSSLGKY